MSKLSNSPAVFQGKWGGKWVELSYTESSMNQMDITTYEVVTKLSFRGPKITFTPKSLMRSGHPCSADAEEFDLPYIGDQPWTWVAIDLNLKLLQDDVYDMDSDTFTKEWKLMRENDYMGFPSMQDVNIKEVDIKDYDLAALLMPAPKCRRFKF